MAAVVQNDQTRTSAEFAEDTILEAFVPSASQVNLQELLEAWDGEIPEDSNSIVPFIEQRQFLLLDELVPVYVVLRTKLIDESSLEAYLARVAITLESRAYGTLHLKPGDAQGEKPAQVNELLFTGSIKTSEEPTICATELQPDGEDKPIQYVYVFWKTSVPINRPKAKINKLAIYFTPSASLKPPEAIKIEVVDDEYLPSRVPQAINLLGPFANDPGLGGLKPKLSALRITRAAPASPVTKQLLRPLRSGSRRLFRTAPAFLWRVRFAKSPALSEPNVTIASVDLEITPFAGSDVVIEKMDLVLSSGQVESLGPQLPLVCRPGDQLTLLYKLRPTTPDNISIAGQPHILTVDASATVLISKSCIPKISIDWNTPVDLPLIRPKSRAGAGKVPPKQPSPDSLPIIDQFGPSESATAIAHGMSFTISGPPNVQVGKIFKWELFVVNRSDKVHRLAVLAMPKRRLGDRRHGSKDSASSFRHIAGDRDSITDPVLDDHVIYTSQRNAVQAPTELVCLSPDVRIGPLAPSACFTAELKFVALASGVLYLDALRVIDLNTQDATDIRDLPDIVAEAKVEE